jgi:hypothetical protein
LASSMRPMIHRRALLPVVGGRPDPEAVRLDLPHSSPARWCGKAPEDRVSAGIRSFGRVTIRQPDPQAQTHG